MDEFKCSDNVNNNMFGVYIYKNIIGHQFLKFNCWCSQIIVNLAISYHNEKIVHMYFHFI